MLDLEDLPGKTVIDKFGNKIKFCTKCEVPVFLDGAVITCKNGCYLGEINWRPSGRQTRASEENDFNPSVTKMCQECRLEGRMYFVENGNWYSEICSSCGGKGTLVEKLYNDDGSCELLDVDEKGRAKCPNCNGTFFIRDPNVWLSSRHRKCGQKLKVPEEWKSLLPNRN